MKTFWLCFVPLFVAVDALGVLPVFMALTSGLPTDRVRKIVAQSVVTATVVALVFAAVGRLVLRLLGITVGDFMIAGGSLLFALSLRDLMAVGRKHPHLDPESIGIVPLAVPLIVGPAVLTTIFLLLDAHGVWPTVLATAVNIGIAGLVFSAAGSVHRVLGDAGTKAVSKLASLLLAAIAVMMVRKGVLALIQGYGARPVS